MLAEARAEAYMAGLDEGQRREVEKRRYLAVETKRDQRSTKGKKSVMVFDTKNDRLVGNDVLDIEKAPKTGSTAQFDTVDTTYVGA